MNIPPGLARSSRINDLETTSNKSFNTGSNININISLNINN